MSPPHSAGVKVVALVAVMLLGALSPSAAEATFTKGTASASDRVRFTFDNGETLKVGTRVRDATGYGYFGVVRASGNGHLTVQKNGSEVEREVSRMSARHAVAQ